MELPTIHKETIADIKDILSEYDFYLTGGTGVYYYLNHRESEDLDFFTREKFNEDILQEKLKTYPVNYKAEGAIYAEIHKVKTSFFYYPYDLIYEKNKINSIDVANLLNILPMKINAIINRGSKKDFIDIYLIMRHLNINGRDVLKICLNKFKNMNEMIFQKSIVYFADADREIMPKMIQNINWEEVKDFLDKEFLKEVFK